MLMHAQTDRALVRALFLPDLGAIFVVRQLHVDGTMCMI